MGDRLLRSGEFITGTLDYVLVVNRNYQILYNNRYDERFKDCINIQNIKRRPGDFFDFYPGIDRSESSIVETMNTGRITIRMNQKHSDYSGRVYYTNNITIPIIREGIIIGVIELVRDVTTVDSIENTEVSTNERLAKTRKNPFFTFDDVLTQDKNMKEVIRRAELFASSDQPTLIYGETGTGKELLAQSMIMRTGVPHKKVIIQNCAAVPESLMETTLFGSYKGAFTGAERVEGLFELADGGVLFLDEINSMPLHVQGKLLRVLQDGTFRPVGAEVEKQVKVKVIGTINVDPMEAIEKSVLRRDLFYRFSRNLLSIPPLRERKNDISYYIKVFLKEASLLYGKEDKIIDSELETFLLNYSWPGNVRELKHLIESLVNVSINTSIGIKDVPVYLYDSIKKRRGSEHHTRDIVDKKENYDLKGFLEEAEREFILKVLAEENNSIGKAAEKMGIPRQTLSYKINKLGI